jgi:hypothetical protein
MSQTVRNDSLDNFETNKDQDLGRAIAEAASTLSNNLARPKRPCQTIDLTGFNNLLNEKEEGTSQDQ